MRWKYAMILTNIEVSESGLEKEIYKLVELYESSEGSGFTSFSNTSIESPEELARAASDVKGDGVNKWFYNNGSFFTNSEGLLDWERTSEDTSFVQSGCSERYSDDEELYSIYGGD